MIDLTSDPSWPICRVCMEASGGDVTKDSYLWCEHIADIIRNNRDSIPPESISQADPVPHIAVPFLPNQQCFAEVGWDKELYPGARMMYLVRRMPGWSKEDFNKEILGIWNVGEKRASICLTVRDWARGESMGKQVVCPSDTTHGYKEAMMVQGLDATQMEVNNFYCFTEGCCYFCHQKMLKFGGSVGLDPDDNFLDPAEGPNAATLAAARERLNRTGTPF